MLFIWNPYTQKMTNLVISFKERIMKTRAELGLQTM